MHVVLVHPEIPQNTGNVARTCAATGSPLHLVHPLGFSIDERAVRRAGLDYWDTLDLTEHPSLDAFMDAYADADLVLLTSNSTRRYDRVSYSTDTVLVFGSETAGLPANLMRDRAGQTARIPTRADARCLNLSNSVAVVLYEALRQLGFPGQQIARPPGR